MTRFSCSTGAALLLLAVLAQPARAADHAALDHYVEAEMRAALLPGIAYAIVQDGRIEHMAAFGVAGPDGRKLSPGTLLSTASVGKTFVALAARQLAEAGKLDLEAPVRRYLPAFRLADEAAAARISVRQLLEHTSGLSSVDGNLPSFFEPEVAAATLVSRMAGLGVNRPPGSSYQYSNLNYLLLGEVIAAASGQSLEGYLREHVLAPLGMRHTYFSLSEARQAGEDVADGYRLYFGFPRAVSIEMPRGALADGMFLTTIEDLARFAIAISDRGRFAGRSLVNPDGFPRANDPNRGTAWQAEANPDYYYGNGHSGGWLNYSAGLEYLPNMRFAVVTLANANTAQVFATESAFDIAFAVMRLYHGWSLPARKPDLRLYYALADGALVLVAALVLVRAWGLRSWRARLASGGRPRYLAWVLIDLVLPLAWLTLVPYLTTGIASPWRGWARFAWSVPDLGYALVVLFSAWALVGLAKLAVGLRARPGRVPARQERRAAVQ